MKTIVQSSLPRTIEWVGGLDGVVRLIDQTLLPGELKMLDCDRVEQVWEAIRVLRVRGAPAIGIAAAFGLVLGVREARTSEEFQRNLKETSCYLAGSRPTAVNLFWALQRMERVAADNVHLDLDALMGRLLSEAEAIRTEDAASGRAIGEAGASLIEPGAGILTHCNAGALATAEFGTALAPMYVAQQRGVRFHVFADETRPLLQGARLTSWELMQAGIDVTLICDVAAAKVMREGRVQMVIVGADRIAANGDTANKIGTYGVALLARAHDIPFYVAAPVSTFDPALASGDAIPIEQRGAEEVVSGFGRRTAPAGVNVYAPAFDVTPASLITALMTDRGLIRPVNTETIAEVLGT